jgi:hypothetical protein
MTDVASIHFKDSHSGGEAWIGLRVEGPRIGLTTSLSSDGDIEVFFERAQAEQLRQGLTKALDLLPS